MYTPVYCVLTRFRTFSLSPHPIWVYVCVCVHFTYQLYPVVVVVVVDQIIIIAVCVYALLSPLCVYNARKGNERGIRYGDTRPTLTEKLLTGEGGVRQWQGGRLLLSSSFFPIYLSAAYRNLV